MPNNNVEGYGIEALKSPISRAYFHQIPQQIINCAMGLKYPVNLEAVKSAISNSIMIKHSRFCSLMVRDKHGREHWQRTNVNIDDHIIVHHHSTTLESKGEEAEEEAINTYLAELAESTQLSSEKPLWEVHVLLGLNCLVLRVHHALGDGASVMSMLSACFGTTNNDSSNKEESMKDNKNSNDSTKRNNWRKRGVLGLIKSLWYTSVFMVGGVGRVLRVKDKGNVLSGGEGVEFWPRKIATAKFNLEDLKTIKKAIPKVTVNDVMLGVISSGLSKYLDHIRSPNGLRINGFVAVNLRRNPGLMDMSDLMETVSSSELTSWGNKSSVYLIPLIPCCSELHPLDHVKLFKSIMDRKKQSFEALNYYRIFNMIISCGGVKAIKWYVQRILCHTTFMVSNMMGPSVEITIGNNPITFIRVNVSSTPCAISIHMVSYAGKADLQLMVAKDVIAEPQLVANFFQESLQEMMNEIDPKKLG